jgi:hypothetical protein
MSMESLLLSLFGVDVEDTLQAGKRTIIRRTPEW